MLEHRVEEPVEGRPRVLLVVDGPVGEVATLEST